MIQTLAAEPERIAPARAPFFGARLDARELGKLGIWLFILSEVLLFGGFLSSYATLRLGNADCRLGAPAWPEAGYLGGLALATANTLILITSSLTMARALRAARAGERGRLRGLLLATVLLGAAFLGVKGCEYAAKLHHGFYPGGPLVSAKPGLGIFFSFYYAMTGLHALHVAAGLLWLALLYKAAARAPMGAGIARKTEFAGLYWHFVDVVWVFLYPLFYLI